ncbi:hypothetical protein [Microvirga tunisiensis]|uniref:Uncharacterized protein n=1 Tax=Microvirga tunisiensis TaxID=2108360 RepID=A0A5N7MRQ0_9HYPH|nr:hypothetical protein [Microvirga tunisiensis]MPR11548.1 hypothetical protein [Microvirga tunisiensis]MPR29548.1 hypothetical protein [Microvirga tunisiensis]
MDEPLVECGEHLGWCRSWFLGGRDEPSAEGSAEGNDGIRAEGPIQYHHSVVQKGFNRDEEEAQALIQSYTHL